MQILLSGASGLVGTDLTKYLVQQGHQVTKLQRDKNNQGIFWDPTKGIIEAEKITGFDAVIHLAGENIANKRWSPSQKQLIRDSRINSTKLLSNTLASLTYKPKVLLTASAIGFYGDRPNETLDENSQRKEGDFLSDTCYEWELATDSAKKAGIRVAHARFGIILSPKGGALSKLLPPFQLGAGGILGNGKQIMSWIALDDVISALAFLLENDISGPVNFTSPESVSNQQFTNILAKVLFRPAIAPVPAFAARLIFGEMADALLLSSAKVMPNKLSSSGYKFLYPNLEVALRHLLSK